MQAMHTIDAVNVNQFPPFDWNTGETSSERNLGNSTRCVNEADMVVYEEQLVVLPKFTEGILLGGHILVMIFSGCGNIAALIIVIKSKAPKLSTKYFLIMLALSDLLMTAVAPPVSIAEMMGDFSEWKFGRLMCKLVPFFQILSATMSAMCLMAIAAERNFLIVRAMSPSASFLNKLWEKWIVPIIAASIILLPIGCALPQVWYYGSRSFLAIHKRPSTSTTTERGTTTTTTASPTTTKSPSFCDIRTYCWRNDFDSSNIIYWSVTGSTYFLLLLCFLISYISIFRFVKKHGQVRKQLAEDYYSATTSSTTTTSTSAIHTGGHDQGLPQSKNKLEAGERHRKTLKLILGLILLHLCCRAPNWIYLVIINLIYVENTETTLTILECFHLLSTINCALNPFLYVIWNHSLRANREENGDGGARKGKPSVVCKKTGNIFHSIFCKCCCVHKQESMDCHVSGDPVMHPTSSVLLWKTPTVYHVSRNSDKSGNGKEMDVGNERILYSEKSSM